MSHVCQGVLLALFLRVASGPVVCGEWGGAGEAGRGHGGRGGHVDGGGGEHQEMSDVRSSDRERCRLCPDDVQEMQTRLLLVLPRIP